MSYWRHTSEATAALPRVLTFDEEDAVEEVLEAAAEWEAGRMTTDQALEMGTAINLRGNPSAAWTRCLAFMHRWSDPRRPALEALSKTASAKDKKILDDGSMVPWKVWNENERNVEEWMNRGGR